MMAMLKEAKQLPLARSSVDWRHSMAEMAAGANPFVVQELMLC